VSVVTRTNLCTNPSFETGTTGWAGKGTTPSLVAIGTEWWAGTQSALITAQTTDGGVGFVASGLTIGQAYTVSGYVYIPATSGAQSVIATVATIGTGTSTSTVGTWTRLSMTATATATSHNFGFDFAGTVSSGLKFYVDAVLIENASTVDSYFDGSSVNANSRVYAWTAAENASTSTEKTYTPAISLLGKTDAPCPRVEITLSDFTPTDNVVNVWSTSDGVRRPVRGARKLTVNGSGAVTDYEAALNRTVTYEIEVTSGLNYGATMSPANVTVASATWWIQDPLVPASAISVDPGADYPNSPALTASAVKALEYAADISLIPVMGSSEPVAIGGQRLAAAGVPLHMVTTAAEATTSLRNLLAQSSVVLLRPGQTGAGTEIPGKSYMAVKAPVERPVTVAWGGSMTRWELVGDTVAAPTAAILVPIWTYGNVQDLWTTYQAAQTALGSKTYLDVYKSPSGA
jgi:hypothetical protein